MVSAVGQVHRNQKLYGQVSRGSDGLYAYRPSMATDLDECLAFSFDGLTTAGPTPALFPFFDGLVPEGWLLHLVSKIRPDLAKDRFSLLLEFGRDTMGDVSVTRRTQKADDEDTTRVVPLIEHQDISTHAARLERCENNDKEPTQSHAFCLSCFRSLSLEERHGAYHARCAQNLFLDLEAATGFYDFSEFEEIAKANLEARLIIPGIQPKASLSLQKQGDSNRLTVAGFGGGLFILKPQHPHVPNFPENEAVIMELARRVGLQTAHSGLIRDRTGRLHYLTRRFDRIVRPSKSKTIAIRRVGMEDMGQLLEKISGQEKYNVTAEQIARMMTQCEVSKIDLKRLFEQFFFSFLVGNCDLHSRNVALLTTAGARLSPAFDLTSTFLIDGPDFTSMSIYVGGQKNSIRRKHFLSFANTCDIPAAEAERLMDNMQRKLKENLSLVDLVMPAGTEKKLRAYAEERIKELDGFFSGRAGETVQ